jgi:hypothetical protein
MLRPVRRQQRFGDAPIRQRRATTLPNQIERHDIGAQPQPFADITGETWTQIAGAGADNDGINLRGRELGRGEGAFGGLGGEFGCVPGEAGVQRVGRQDKCLLQTLHRQMSGGNSVFTGQHFLEQRVGACVQLQELGCVLQRCQTLRLCKTPRRNSRAKSD